MYKVDKVTFECPVESLFNILDKKWVGIKMLTQQLDMSIENEIKIKL